MASMIISQVAWAQETKWFDGTIVTANEDTVRERLSYDLASNVVYTQNETTGRHLVYAARGILSFFFYDQELQRTRVFYSLPYKSTNTTSTFYLFEAIVEGPISLLGRDYLMEGSDTGITSPSDRMIIGSVWLQRWNYYYITPQTSITPFTVKRREVLEILDKHRDEVKDFIQEWGLELEFQKDLIKVFEYYNELEVGSMDGQMN